MPTRESNPQTGAPCWVDLSTSDVDRARGFYSSLFGWTAGEPNPEFGGYCNFLHDGSPIAGCMAAQAESPGDLWTVYLATDDATKTVEAAEANGGTTHVPPMPVADLGTMALVTDNAQHAIGMWQPGAHKGFTTYGEPNTPSWFELHTTDYDATLGFYRDVFGWDTDTVSDTPDFRYTILHLGDEQLAGVMDASPHADATLGWSVYFGVDDTDRAVARTTELGGTVVSPAEDTPYGRLAVAADPTGARFKLVGPNDAMPLT